MIALAALIAAAALPTIVSPAPDRVAVTVYRDPERRRSQAMQPGWLGGFALVTETRTIAVPAGDATIRFESVMGGIIPASAIVDGLPGGTIEKNRDARLLSPAALVDGTLGRRVTLRRTDKASGAVHEEDAEIVAGPEGGVVVRTAQGIETLGCSGLGEGIRYSRVPAGLAAKPSLSVVTRSPRAATATITLSYLSSGFDWTASYVATLATDGRTLDLSAWLTLANANREGFPNAQLQAVAGRLERQRTMAFYPAATRLELRCYPLGTTTSDLPETHESGERNEIIVTAMRMAAPAPPPLQPPPALRSAPLPPEDLGDLKLYRVPERVGIAASGQKQVALLRKARIPFTRGYRFRLWSNETVNALPATILIRMRNRADAGLGIALPAGTTALYTRRGGAPLLLGQGNLDDHAIGERVDLAAGTSRQLTAAQTITGATIQVTVSNANPTPAIVDVRLGEPATPTIVDASDSVSRIDGYQTWHVIVPGNREATLTYRASR